MQLNIVHQSSYSRGELLLRSFFGFFYIMIPHGFCLYFLTIWALILRFITFFAILFTGEYPESFFNYFVRLFRWNLRVSALLNNLSDGYPAFGLSGMDDRTSFDVTYHKEASRGNAVLVFLLGGLVLLPHIFCIIFLAIASLFVKFIAWWAVLFTGKYPDGMHDFMTRFTRWNTRLSVYLFFMDSRYPPFHGRPDEAKEIYDDLSSSLQASV